MPDFNQPSEIAREVLLRLAQRRIQPTPDNYLALYHEITGKPVPDIFPEKAIKSLAAGLPRHTAEQVRVGRKLDQAASEKSWDHLRQTLTEVLDKVAAEPPAWSALIRDLLSQLEIRSTGLTTAQKKEALDHVLAASGNPLIARWLLDDAKDARLRLSERLHLISGIAATRATSGLGYDWMHAHLGELLRGGGGIFFAARLPQVFANLCSVEKADAIARDFGPSLAGKTAQLELDRTVERVRDCGVLKAARAGEASAEIAALK